MERIKFITLFLLLALAGAGWTLMSLYFGRLGPSIELALAGPAALLMGAGGLGYQVYMAIYDAWHRRNVTAADPIGEVASGERTKSSDPDRAGTLR